MPAFLRATNYPQDYETVGQGFLWSTSGFDAAYVGAGVRLDSATQEAVSGIGTIPTILLSAAQETSDLWVQFRIAWNSSHSGSTIRNFRIHDASGVEIGSLMKDTATTITARAVTTNGSANATLSASGLAPNTLTVRCQMTVDDIIITAYTNGAQFSTATASRGGRGLPRTIVIGDLWTLSPSTARWCVISEVLVTDGIDPRGLRVSARRPSDNGFHDTMSGSAAGLADGSDGTGVLSDAAGQRFSWEPEAYAGPGSPTAIRAVMTGAKVLHEGGEPNRLRQSLRIDGTDYDGPLHVPGTLTHHVAVWEENPDTEASWTVADLAALEVGLVSANA